MSRRSRPTAIPTRLVLRVPSWRGVNDYPEDVTVGTEFHYTDNRVKVGVLFSY